MAPGRLATLLLLALLPAVLPACGQSGPEQAYAQYLARLARTLSVTADEAPPPPTPQLPAPRELRRELAPGKLGALDFLALSGCAVQVTIGKRNSSLGRMARPSQRLLLELEYLRLAPACISYQREQGEEALATTLEEAWELKRGQLPALIFNATLGSSEYRQLWQTPAASADYPGNTSSAVISALATINSHAQRWLDGDFRADNQAFELLLSEAATGDGGALLQALAIQAGFLTEANRMLDERLAQGPLCAPGIRLAAADILATVVRKYFVAGIQPRAAALNRRYHELLPPLWELEQMLETDLPLPHQSWRQQRDNAFAELALAPRRHVEELQAIQQPCTPQ